MTKREKQMIQLCVEKALYTLQVENLLLRNALREVVDSHEQGDTPLAIDAAINRAADVLEKGAWDESNT